VQGQVFVSPGVHGLSIGFQKTPEGRFITLKTAHGSMSDSWGVTRNLRPYQEFARSMTVCSFRRRRSRFLGRHT
jgi:hypothetical protein